MPTTPQDRKRPSLAKKQTRAGNAKADDMLNDGLEIELDGKSHTVRLGDMTAMDARALRQQTGYSLPQLMVTMVGDGVDIDLIAAVIWLARRLGGEKSLSYEEVADEIGYDVIDRVVIKDPSGGEDEDPEAPGGR